MLEWLFGSSPRTDPPTDKQLRYAKKLGIVVSANADRATLSQLIGEAESKNPSLKANREIVKQKQLIRKYGQARVDEKQRWEDLADKEKWMLVVFNRGNSKISEIVRINGGKISARGKMKVLVETVKIINDRFAGQFIDVGRYLELSLDKIVWHEIVDEIDVDDIQGFQKYLSRLREVS